MTVKRYLEEFAAGQTWGTSTMRVDAGSIMRFAAEFDPQPFHLDEAAAAESPFHGLAASGWHTAAMTQRLLSEGEVIPAGGIVGLGFEELRWPKPVRPEDELRVEGEVLDVRPSRSRPGYGMVKVRATTLNQLGEAVQVLVATLFVPSCRASESEFGREQSNSQSPLRRKS